MVAVHRVLGVEAIEGGDDVWMLELSANVVLFDWEFSAAVERQLLDRLEFKFKSAHAVVSAVMRWVIQRACVSGGVPCRAVSCRVVGNGIGDGKGGDT
jgi:hypothetical protein